MPGPASLLPQRNCLDLVRLVLATLVVVSHVWAVPGHGPVHLGGYDVGRLAVVGFFAVSGYLVTRSRLRTSSGRYLWHRALRILPALAVVTVVTAAVLGPVSLLLEGAPLHRYDVGSAITYPLRNLTLLWPQPGLGGTIAERSFAADWNVPLWTLGYEALCYVGLLVLVALGALRWRWLVPAVTTLLIVTNVAGIGLPGYTHHLGVADVGQLATFAIPFGCGASLALLEPRVPRSPLVGVLAVAAVVAVCTLVGESVALVSLPLAVALLWVARTVPPLPVLTGTDLSYGVYIWGYPVQQVLMTAGLWTRSPWLLLAATAAGTALLALASWRWVERPALRLKGWSPRLRPTVASTS